MGDRERNVQLLQWVETALGTPLYPDEERRQQVTEYPEVMLAGTLRNTVAQTALREVARQRLYDRRSQAIPIEPQEFSRQWDFTEEKFFEMPKTIQNSLMRTARHVIVLNNLEEARQQHRADLRLDQIGALDKIIASIGRESNIPTEEPSPPVGRGILAKSPTGSGKSRLKGSLLAYARIGQPASLRDPRPLQAAVIVPSAVLSEQHAGRRGKSSLLHAAPDVDVSLRHGSVQETQRNVHITTVDSYINDVRGNKLHPDDIDLTLVDEAHHILAPRMQKLLSEGKLGKLVVGFTATEKYSEENDLKKLLTYFYAGDSLVSYMNQGLLNGGQFFSYKVDLRKDQIPVGASRDTLNSLVRKERDKHVVEAARQLISEGRQIVVYCDPGKSEDASSSAHAHKLVKDITKSLADDPIIGPDGKIMLFTAKAVTGNTNSSRNRLILQDFDAGRVQIITAVRALGEGWDSKVNGVIFATNTTSRLTKEQQLGRGTRVNKDFPLTVYIEFMVSTFGYHPRLVSFWDILGMDTVEQGYIIGAEDASKRQNSPGPRRAIGQNKSFAPTDDLAKLFTESDKQLVSALTFSVPEYENRLPIPRDYLPLEQLREIDPNYISDYHLITTLERAGIGRMGKWTRTKDGVKRMSYFYPPTAKAYMEKNPAPPIRSREDMTIEVASKVLGVGIAFIRNLINDPESPVTTVEKTTRGVKFNYLDAEAIVAIRAEIEKIPEATEGHIRIVKLIEEIDMSEAALYKFCARNNVDYLYLRFTDEDTGRIRFGFHLTLEDANRLFVLRHAYDYADADDMTISDMSRAAGVPHASIRQRITNSEGTTKITASEALPKHVVHYPIEVAHDAIEAARKKKLPPHRVTVTTLQNLFNRPSYVIRHFLDGRSDVGDEGKTFIREGINLQSGPPTICYSWNVIPILIEAYGEPDIPIHVKNLPQDDQDSHLGHISFAMMIQQEYGEKRVVRAADDIVAHAKGKPESDAEPLRPGVLPKVILEKSTKISTLRQTYNPNHPESMDISDIHTFTGIPVLELENFFKNTKIAGSLPPEQRINKHGQLVLHYRGRGLKAALMTLMGVPAPFMAAARDVPLQVVMEFLHGIKAQPNKHGGYPISVWYAFAKTFRNPPPGWRAVREVKTRSEYLRDMDTTEIVNFVLENGGTTDVIFYKGKQTIFLSPLSVLLLANQTLIKAYPAIDQYNREEIAALAFRTPKEFDEWIHQRPAIKERMTWSRVRTGEKVLPHFNKEDIESFITEGQNRARRQKR